ncbi:magnesium and cobalt transport protein CorA [Phenylobacterium terrae]|uniref:Magnesium and cobalt transport protein CorA n=1 Tax=Phenylobacterium terrae TaxID=2665495 RepID=A0ABW4N103_9CAUL
MSVVAAYIYRDGVRDRPIDIASPAPPTIGQGEFAWIGMVSPSADELQTLARCFNLHPLAVEDALKAHQLPKLDVYGEQLFIVARTAQYEGGAICYGETHIFVGRGHIITVRHGSARAHTELRHELEAAPQLLRHGVDYVVHALLDFIVDGYLPIVEAVEEEVLGMERRTLDTFLSRGEITRLFVLRRELMKFGRTLGQMHALCSKLENLDLPGIDPEARPYFRDVLDHVMRVLASVDSLRDVIRQVFDVSSLLEQQRQGAITRQLAAWAAILAVPTAVAGIYGMNFEHMPELGWRFGYAGVWVLILAVCVTLYVNFKRRKWL